MQILQFRADRVINLQRTLLFVLIIIGLDFGECIKQSGISFQHILHKAIDSHIFVTHLLKTVVIVLFEQSFQLVNLLLL